MEILDKFVYNSYVRIGDRVILNIDKESREYHHSRQSNGQKGTVTGFNRTVAYKGRNETYIYGKSGKFEYNGSPIVLWDNGVTEKISANDLSPVEPVLQARSEDKAYIEAFNTVCFVEPLPQTLFFEGDMVRLNNVCEFDRAIITNIDYSRLLSPEGLRDDKHIPVYSLICCQIDGQEHVKLIDKWRDRVFKNSDISRILERGNYWNWEHDKRLLKFYSPEHEKQFYDSLGFQVPDYASQ